MSTIASDIYSSLGLSGAGGSSAAKKEESLGQADFRSMAQRGSAHALSYLDRPDEALQAAERARQLGTAVLRPVSNAGA